MRLAVVLHLLLAATFGATAARAGTVGIIGEDDRRVLEDKAPVWNAIGRVNRESGGFCTGVLVAPGEVATAAHCLWNHKRRAFLPLDSIHFVAGYRRGEFAGHAKVKAIRTDPTLAFDAKGLPNELARDWAILILDRPVADGKRLRPLPIASPADRAGLAAGGTLVRVGYGADRPHLPVKVEPCRPLAADEARGILLHDCDATFGDSGSPLMIRRGNTLALLAVQTAIVPYKDKPVGAAILLGREIPASALLAGPAAGPAPANSGPVPLGAASAGAEPPRDAPPARR